ncbi:iron ABC transporter permease [Hahella aquimaris]|uniref:FecCD family ABC transporter permease n=1 Tax=Hahella sp. HNIBRBA332 TaxID=3015983 RepID=UPI00273A8A04|nr:iron ABC transporter permease [Hahella sp. HNIBRBA332]WLQ13528.1 iron ABC transporter permease [Hahella sp. HNIBRBA332]
MSRMSPSVEQAAPSLGLPDAASFLPAGSRVVRIGSLSMTFNLHDLISALLILLVILLAVCASLMLGSTHLSLSQVWQAILGEGSPAHQLLTMQIRLPRIAAGLVVGACLGAAGCLLQGLARNRLATPDILGVHQGATLAVVIAMLAGAGGVLDSWWAAIIGASATLLGVLAFSGRFGSNGYRILVIGLGLTYLLRAMTEVLVTYLPLHEASAMYTWSIGTLLGRDYAIAAPAFFGLCLLLPVAVVLARQLTLLQFGEDTAASLGLNPERLKIAVVLTVAVLTALSVTVSGPINFIALMAPVTASFLARPDQTPVLRSTLLGALFVIVADTIGRIYSDVETPMGVIATMMGGPFLLAVILFQPQSRQGN